MKFLVEENGSFIATQHNPVASGGQAELFLIHGREELVAKIFYPGKACAADKIRWMIRNPPNLDSGISGAPTIAWPLSLLLHDNHSFAGYIMPFLTGRHTLYRYITARLGKKYELPSGTIFNFHLAGNVASIVNEVHRAGYVIGDINEENILVDDRAMATIIDTDSFAFTLQERGGGCTFYPCTMTRDGYRSPEYLASSSQGNYHHTRYDDRFALGVLLWKILRGGFHPFDAKDVNISPQERIRLGLFPYLPQLPVMPPDNAPPLSGLHEELQSLFIRCFTSRISQPVKRPSAEEWLHTIRGFL